MTHVVTEACIRCRYTDCVDVCPTDAFRAGRNMLVIRPHDCIDCAVCVPECPVGAIVSDQDLPAGQADYLALNARLAQQWPVISAPREPLPDAEHWATAADKRGHLIEHA